MSRAEESASLDITKIPKHVAIIMDGNGRWAKQRSSPRVFGHREGIESIRSVVRRASALGVKALTLYAFSQENWKRPKPEVYALMQLLKEFLDREEREMMENKIRLISIGCLEELPDFVRKRLDEVMRSTAGNEGLILNLALSYGSRGEIVRAVRSIVQDVLAGKVDKSRIDEEIFGAYLDTAALPDPDLLIRTSGEMRISNFLLWQISYTELYITRKLWPEFRAEDFDEAIVEFQRRERRFGR